MNSAKKIIRLLKDLCNRTLYNLISIDIDYQIIFYNMKKKIDF